MPRQPEAYRSQPPAIPARRLVGNAYWAMVWYGFLYFTFGAMGRRFFPHYEHHRPLMIREALPWIRAAWRKHWYAWRERGIQERLTTDFSRRYFLVPLQVFNDAQLTVHADLDGVESFIQRTLSSFARHAEAGVILVFKHHPMDRGYRDYRRLIRDLASHHGVEDRVLYIHDQHLPSLLDHAQGVVVVNSTVGLSALHHGAPTFVCGKAMYDMPGLTYQGELDEFWNAAPDSRPDRELYAHFRARLIQQTQINGSFYRRLKGAVSRTGLAYVSTSHDASVPFLQPDTAQIPRVQHSEPASEWMEAPVGVVIRSVESPSLPS
jgi:capsular polysaccharide export protein